MKCKINTRLLPIKAHYFLFWGGLAGVMPYLTIFGQSLGISASAVGIIVIIFPLVSVVAKPLFGSLADRYQKLKLLMLIFLPIAILFYFVITFISPIEKVNVQSILLCADQGSELGMPLEWSKPCSESLEEVNFTSTIHSACVRCKIKNQTGLSDFSNVTDNQLDCLSDRENFNFSLSIEYVKRNKINNWFPIVNLTMEKTVVCDKPELYKCQTIFPAPHTEACAISHNKIASIFLTPQFWLFLCFFIASRSATSVLISFSDTACFNLLEGQYHKYGKQRFWGALGWGVFSLVNSYISSTYSTDNKPNLFTGFYMMVVLLSINFIIVCFADIRNSHTRGKIAKNVGQVLKNIQVLIFLTGVLAMGILTGIFWTYYFWFLSTLGATSLQFGAVLVVQTFLGEMPFFFLAGWVINKIGNRNALSLSLGAFGVRFLACSYVTNPWMALPIELTQGLTFGIFYTLMTTYAKAVTPPGTEATMQGLVGGTFEGLGMAIAGLAGFGFDQLGQRTTFRITAFFAFVCCGLHIIAHIIFKLLKYQSSECTETLPAIKTDEETSFLPNSGQIPVTITPNTA